MYISTIGIVKIKDSLLFIKKQDSDEKIKYIFPGGHWEFPEKFSTSAIREVYEETGVKTHNPKLLRMYLNIKRSRVELYFKLESIDENNINLEVIDKTDERLFEPVLISIKDIESLRIKNPYMKKIALSFI